MVVVGRRHTALTPLRKLEVAVNMQCKLIARCAVVSALHCLCPTAAVNRLAPVKSGSSRGPVHWRVPRSAPASGIGSGRTPSVAWQVHS